MLSESGPGSGINKYGSSGPQHCSQLCIWTYLSYSFGSRIFIYVGTFFSPFPTVNSQVRHFSLSWKIYFLAELCTGTLLWLVPYLPYPNVFSLFVAGGELWRGRGTHSQVQFIRSVLRIRIRCFFDPLVPGWKKSWSGPYFSEFRNNFLG